LLDAGNGQVGLAMVALCRLRSWRDVTESNTSGLAPLRGDQPGKNATVDLYRSVSGPISLNASVISLNAVDSIICSGPATASGDAAISAPGSSVNIQTTTVFGTASGRIVEAGNWARSLPLSRSGG